MAPPARFPSPFLPTPLAGREARGWEQDVDHPRRAD